jgi:hypothetical protein
LLVHHQRKHVTPALASVAEENLSLGMYKERRIPLVMQWAQTHPLATAPANVSEPGDEIHQVNACLHSCRVGVTRRKRIRSEFHDGATLDVPAADLRRLRSAISRLSRLDRAGMSQIGPLLRSRKAEMARRVPAIC